MIDFCEIINLYPVILWVGIENVRLIFDLKMLIYEILSFIEQLILLN